ncbi:MAG: type II toxin-antitoxin system death-on-curing family toxin [Candidatus Hadarchaeia archaeon]
MHERVLENDPNVEEGYSNKGLIGACMDRAVSDFYGETQFEGIYDKTAALIQGLINFHPFVDGNKRTALLSSIFFLFFHGHKFSIIREDILNTFRGIAKEEIDDFDTISRWVERNTTSFNIAIRTVLLAVRIQNEKIDLVSIFGGSGVISKILNGMEKAWPED